MKKSSHPFDVGRRMMIGAGFLLASNCLLAQAWPQTKPIRIVVPFSAGGATDIAARLIAQSVGESMKAAVVVENKPGAHGVNGVMEVVRSAADGHTILMASIGTMAINPALYKKLPYDPNKDLTPISLVTTSPNAVVVNPDVLNVQNLQDFVKYLKKNPGKVNFGTAGAGNSGHVTAEYFKYRTGTFMTHIPYRGESAAMNDLLAGQVQVMFVNLLSATPHIKSGKLRIIGVTSKQRLSDYPEVPTVAESLGINDFDAVSWQALYAPAGVRKEILDRLAAEVDAALKRPAVIKRLSELMAQPSGSGPEALMNFQLAEQEKWGRVIRVANISPDS